ncbi:uncharacterized protein PRCAT00002743001 [Priceomyces carsonii]|uniref:uncharacterized protein n=1 Tax=Priceomyces carsonii TaxID=28549 RepID=UPI002ED7E494|nr:unnamed protein product [Priceomyces carsonii]
MRMIIPLLFLHVSLCVALNVMVSTTDSWVAKNVRFLYQSLKEEGHNVILVGPLYGCHEKPSTLTRRSGKPENDGGDFGHLLPVHQTYYKNMKRLNRAKNVLTRAEIDRLGSVTGATLGQDPMDKDVWYVNSLPLETLSMGLDVILPHYYPDFVPDLVVIGPNEGLALTNTTKSTELQSMLQLLMIKDIPGIGVSTQDNHHVYFQDENFFNIDNTFRKVFKNNAFGKNIKFICSKVNQLISEIGNFPLKTVLNINFPSMNHENSQCSTSLKANPEYVQISYDNEEEELPLRMKRNISKYSMGVNEIILDGEYGQTLDKERPRDKISAEEDELATFVDKESSYYLDTIKRLAYSDKESENREEFKALTKCSISVNVENLDHGSGLPSNYWNVMERLESH